MKPRRPCCINHPLEARGSQERRPEVHLQKSGEAGASCRLGPLTTRRTPAAPPPSGSTACEVAQPRRAFPHPPGARRRAGDRSCDREEPLQEMQDACGDDPGRAWAGKSQALPDEPFPSPRPITSSEVP